MSKEDPKKFIAVVPYVRSSSTSGHLLTPSTRKEVETWADVQLSTRHEVKRVFICEIVDEVKPPKPLSVITPFDPDKEECLETEGRKKKKRYDPNNDDDPEEDNVNT